jgi:hypothetical protein
MQTAVIEGGDDVLDSDLVVGDENTFDDQAEDLLLDCERGLD